MPLTKHEAMEVSKMLAASYDEVHAENYPGKSKAELAVEILCEVRLDRQIEQEDLLIARCNLDAAIPGFFLESCFPEKTANLQRSKELRTWAEEATMNNITLTAQQAAELHTTGRLTGYREKCDPVEGMTRVIRHDHPTLGVQYEVEWHELNIESRTWEHGTVTLTPPRDTDTTYAVKEPCEPCELGHLNDRDPSRWDVGVYYHCDDKDKCRNYGCQETCFLWMECPKEAYDALADSDDGDWLTAEEMPDWAVRQHARITDIKLIIENGELWWDMDLEKVG